MREALFILLERRRPTMAAIVATDILADAREKRWNCEGCRDWRKVFNEFV